MTAVKLVTQETLTDCGLACVAMVSGKSLEAVRKIAVKELGYPKDGPYTTTHDNLYKLLAHFGIGHGKKAPFKSLTYTFDTLSRSASRQLSGQRAGMFLVGLDGLEAESLMEVAHQDSTGDQPPTALRVKVSDFLASQGRDHVVGVGFISKGALRPASGGVTDSGGSAYVFPKRESPFWHSDFSGLFAERV